MQDIVVIGGGASGLFVAGGCAKKGYNVLLIEKNEKVGKKLYITGKGRCNITNLCETQQFFENVATNPKFLYSSIFSFSPHDTMQFFESNGQQLKVERGNRVFPKSDKSSDIIKVLQNYCLNNGVKIQLNEQVLDCYKNSQINKFIVKTTKNEYICDKLVFATGGKSYSATGSDGNSYKLIKKFGHKIIEPKPALCPIKLKDKWVKQVEGMSLKNVRLSAYSNGKLIRVEFGEMLFTSNGISGPIVLTLSSFINKVEDVELVLDFKPVLSIDTLDNRLIREFESNKNSQIITVMKNLLPKNFVPIFLDYVNIHSDTKVNTITVEQRNKVITSLKQFRLNFDRLYDIDYAIITSGGVNVNEINPKTMESKIVSDLYFAGEVIDIDALTGGFNLQIALATANSIVKGV